VFPPLLEFYDDEKWECNVIYGNITSKHCTCIKHTAPSDHHLKAKIVCDITVIGSLKTRAFE